MKNVKIEDAAYDVMKSVCKKYGMKMYKFASDAIVELCIVVEKKNDKSGRKIMSNMWKNNQI
jgi:hypothetical protein